MTSKERIIRALRYGQPDCVPIFEQLIVSKVSSSILGRSACTGGGELARDIAEALRRGERDALVQRYEEDIAELHRKLGLDAVQVELVPPTDAQEVPEKVSNATYYYRDSYGPGTFKTCRFSDESGQFFELDSTIRRKGPEGVQAYCGLLEKKMAEPFVTEDGRWEALDYVKQKMGDKKAICLSHILKIPIEKSWLEATVLYPKLVEVYLDYQLRESLVLLKEAACHGVDFIMGGGDLASKQGPVFSPSLFETMLLPRFKEIISFSHSLGLPYVFRTDGNTRPLWRQLFVDSGADGYGEIDPTAGMDIGELKQTFPELVLWGNVDCGETLVHGAKEVIVRETKECMQKGKPGGGYLFGSSNSIHYGVPAKNFLYMLEAARRHNHYGG